jgi:spermidine synthase
VGGGEGASLREILRHPSVEEVTVVELDEEIIRLARRHLGSWHRGAFDSPKIRLLYQDGRELLETSEDAYDVVVVDVTDLLDDGPARALYTEEFYRLVKRRLSRPGLVIVQGLPLSPLDYDQHATLLATLKAVFPIVRSYKTFIPSFWTDWGFLIASEDLDSMALPVAELAERIRLRLGNPPPPLGPLTFYGAEEHRALFHIPGMLQVLLQKAGRVLKDADIRRSAIPTVGHD